MVKSETCRDNETLIKDQRLRFFKSEKKKLGMKKRSHREKKVMSLLGHRKVESRDFETW